MSAWTRKWVTVGDRRYSVDLANGLIARIEVHYNRVTRPFTSPAPTSRTIWASWTGPGGRRPKITTTATKVALALGLSFQE